MANNDQDQNHGGQIVTAKTEAVQYLTLQQMMALKPAEDDVDIDGAKYRVRGLLSGEVQRISRLVRDPQSPTGVDDNLDRTYTVAFGLVQPSLAVGNDAESLEAAKIVIDGLPNAVRNALASRIVRLTLMGGRVPVDQSEALAAAVAA